MSAPTLVDQKAQPKTVALFVSDLHLSAQMPKTAAAFFRFLNEDALTTHQLYLLGDIFEYWAGDDDIDEPFNRKVIDALRALTNKGVALYWMAGNRDFLVGDAFAQATGMRLLPDPYIADIGGQRMLLVHGDAQCTDDKDLHGISFASTQSCMAKRLPRQAARRAKDDYPRHARRQP